MQSRVTGLTGKCPLHGTVCKQAPSLLPSTPGNQAALVRLSCCTAHRHCREHSILSRQKQSSVGCWLQNETQCSLCAQPRGSPGVWGQQLLLSLQGHQEQPSCSPPPLPHTSTCGTGRHIPCWEQMALVIPFSFLLLFEGEQQDFLK